MKNTRDLLDLLPALEALPVAQSLELELEDFDLTPFVEKGGLGGARKVFGVELGSLVKELNEVLSA